MRRAHGDPPAPMPAGESPRHRNGGQRVISVNTLFWKILVTRVKRKMREGKILRPLRQLTAANSANQRRAPLPTRASRRRPLLRQAWTETLPQCAIAATSRRWSTR